MYVKIHYFQYGRRLTRHSEQLCLSQSPKRISSSASLLLSLHPPPPSFITVFSLLCGSRTPQMQRNGKWSDTMAFKALPLPCPSLFIFYPNKCSRKQEAKTKKQKHQETKRALSLHLAELFFFSFVLPTKWSLGLLTKPHYSLHISKNQLYKSSSKEQLSIWTSMQWSTSSDCSSY